MLNGFKLSRYKKILFDFLTFSYPLYRIILFSIVIFFLFILPIGFLENLPNLSVCSFIFRKYCYSIGITRGVSSLLKGNFDLAISYNFLSIPVLIFLIAFIIKDFIYLTKKKE